MLSYNEIGEPKEIKAYYQWFQDNYPSLMERAKELLGKNILEFSIEEIDLFGNLIKENLKTGLELDKQSVLINAELANTFIVYYGSAWMRHFGGKWYYSVKKSEYGFGFPMIIDYGPIGAPWVALNPYDYLIMTLDSRMPNLSELFREDFERFTRKGITNYKR